MTVLDTDHLRVLERRDQPGSGVLRARLAHLPPSDVVTTIISYENKCEAGWRIWHVHGPWHIRSKPIDGCCSIWTTTDGFQFYRRNARFACCVLSHVPSRWPADRWLEPVDPEVESSGPADDCEWVPPLLAYLTPRPTASHITSVSQ